MKKVIIVSCLSIVTFINAQGQWYTKEYNVTDINLLSKEQLEESLVKSKKNILTSGGVAAFGGVLFIFFRYAHPGLSEDPGFIEELIGPEGMDKIGMVTSAGIIAGGAIAGIAYLGRIGRIKSTINRNYPSGMSLNISPVIIRNNYTQSYCSGLTLIYRF